MQVDRMNLDHAGKDRRLPVCAEFHLSIHKWIRVRRLQAMPWLGRITASVYMAPMNERQK